MYKVHFPGLNALRFIAAFSVIIGHIELIKREYGISNIFSFMPNGRLGVILFFVLSGFLITFLLLKEQEEFKKVSIKKFYIRRVLRIWPLYFLLTLICYFAIPLLTGDVKSSEFFHSHSFGLSLVLYLVFLPNIAFQLMISVPMGYHLWSIGVEEQFYLLWPALIKYFRKHILKILITLFFVLPVAPYALDYISNNFELPVLLEKIMSAVSKYLGIAKFNVMAAGGIAAYIYFKKYNFIKYFWNNYTELIVFFTTFLLWIFRFKFKYFTDEFYAILFAIIILNISTKPNALIKLEKRWLDYLGKISYGLYMYHWISIVFVMYFIRNVFGELELGENIYIYNMLMYPLAIALTIILSAISYELFEKRFLKLKTKYTNIHSG